MATGPADADLADMLRVSPDASPPPPPVPDAAEPDAAPLPPDAEVDAAPPPPPPPADETGLNCVIGADCPEGQYCDLGVCVQSCNSGLPCEPGEICTERGRCVPSGERDQEPPPEVEQRGEVSISPDALTILPGTRQITLQLTSTAPGPVRYRVAPTVHWLRAEQETGEFVGQSTLEFAVDPHEAVPGEAPGVLVVSELGDTFTDVTEQTSLTGYYGGAMTYGSESLPLGAASAALTIEEHEGALAIAFDPLGSLLFPAMTRALGTVPVTGAGTYNAADALLDFTVTHEFDASFGGPRNPFQRRIVRHVRFLLQPGVAPGSLQGSFRESIDGVLPTTLSAEGSVTLQFHPGVAVQPVLLNDAPAEVAEPNAGEYLRPSDVFAWQDDIAGEAAACRTVLNDACDLAVPPERLGDCRSNAQNYTDALYTALVAPLEASFRGVVRSEGYAALADDCVAAIDLRARSGYQPGSPASRCGLIAPLACLLPAIQNRGGDAVAQAQLYSRTVGRLIQPALLVAKEHAVRGLRASFVEGTVAERREYETALDRLRPFARWLSQPAVLESLRTAPAEGARGNPDLDADTFPAMMGIGDLFNTMATIAGEVARIDASTGAADRPTIIRRAQETAVVSLMQSLVVAALVDAWRADAPDLTVPETALARFLGVLGPLDRAMTAATRGANVFGVPDGFVPFVYRPNGGEPTNFEQMLAIARSAVEAHGIVETAWMGAQRELDQNENATRMELLEIRLSFDDRLRGLCGSTFEPDRPDWNACGSGETGGAVGERLLGIREVEGQIRTARARLDAQLRRIDIAERTAARVLRLRVENLGFQLSTGQRVNALSAAQRVGNVIVTALQIACQAQLWNGGAPLAMAVVAAVVETVNAALEGMKDELRLAQQAVSLQTDLQAEQLSYIKEIQNEWVTYAMLAVEGAELGVRLMQAQMATRNTLDEARLLWEERERALAELNRSVVRDPSHRVMRDRRAIDVIRARADAQREVDLAARALQYELNLPLAGIDGAVMNASSADRMRSLLFCLENIHNQDLEVFAGPVPYETRVSVRGLLGITGARVDEVTGQSMTEGEQFRALVLRSRNFDEDDGLSLSFATALAEGNGLWSTDVCRDRIESVQAELIGDFLGDNDAQVNLALDGTGFLRACAGDAMQPWSFGSGDAATSVAVIQAGVNGPGLSAPNTSLFGQPVARARWRLTIPSARRAPSNRDVDLTHLDDIVLVVRHTALPQRPAAFELNIACLSAGN